MNTIREATIKDIPVIQALAREAYFPAYSKIHTLEQNQYSFGTMYSHESLMDQFTIHKSRFFILSDDGTDKAYMAIVKTSDTTWLLDKLYTLPGYQGKGYGKALLMHAERIVSNESIEYRIELHVNRRNSAVGFYRKHGYEIIDQWDIEIADGKWTMDGYTMAKTINKLSL